MDFPIESHYITLLGIFIVTVVMLRLTVNRIQKNAEKKRRHEEAIRAAEVTERQKQMQSVLQKSKVSAPKTRVPLGDPFAAPFTGKIQGMAAKWEAEIHQLGRQIIGQIDSKMAALQTISLEANRTANRLEILVEHVEHIARQQIEWQQSQIAQNAADNTQQSPTENLPSVIPAAESAAQVAPLAVVLKELANDIEGVRKTIKRSTALGEQPVPSTIFPPPEADLPSSIRGEVEMLLNYGVEPVEIARRLNISPGEVDLILQVQQNRIM